MRKIIFNTLSILIFVSSVALGIYVGEYSMLVKEILMACKAFNEGILTGTLIGATILKCILANIVTGLIFLVGEILALLFQYYK